MATHLNPDTFYAYSDSIKNPRKLSIEELKRDEGAFTNICDEEALEIIDGLYKLSIICYKIYIENQRRNETRQIKKEFATQP